jgi:tight adherence protein B
MARMRARMELGVSLDGALSRWVEERPVAGVRAAAGALTLSSAVGGPAADAIDGLASSVADRIAATAETRAQSAQARASALVMVVAPIGYLLFASTIDQRSLDVLLGTTFGRACLGAGLALDALAVLWIRFLLRPDPEV